MVSKTIRSSSRRSNGLSTIVQSKPVRASVTASLISPVNMTTRPTRCDCIATAVAINTSPLISGIRKSSSSPSTCRVRRTSRACRAEGCCLHDESSSGEQHGQPLRDDGFIIDDQQRACAVWDVAVRRSIPHQPMPTRVCAGRQWGESDHTPCVSAGPVDDLGLILHDLGLIRCPAKRLHRLLCASSRRAAAHQIALSLYALTMDRSTRRAQTSENRPCRQVAHPYQRVADPRVNVFSLSKLVAIPWNSAQVFAP
jgi:hypothetical protein